MSDDTPTDDRLRDLAARLQTTQPGLRARLLHPALRSAAEPGADLEPLLDTLAALPAGADTGLGRLAESMQKAAAQPSACRMRF